MTGRIANGVRLFFLVQWRSYFPHTYLLVALLTVVAFRVALPEEIAEWLLPVFLFAEPGLLGLLMVAAQSFLERGEGSASALALTPLSSGEHVLALVGTAALIGTAAGLVIQAGVGGVDLRLLRLGPPLFAVCLLAGFIGLAVSAHFGEFTRFLVGGYVPALVLLEAPVLTYFELLPRWTLLWHPGDSSLGAIQGATAAGPLAAGLYAVQCLVVFAFAAAAFTVSRRVFAQRVRARLETT